jgi:two-component sensor histidine kinase
MQAIAMQTLRRTPGKERDAFMMRLQALAKAHDLLSLKSWDSAPLRDVVGVALGAFQETHRERFQIEGQGDVWLGANKALLLAMALHELATNAAKYGALSNANGRIRVAGELSKDDGASPLMWRERGGPMVEPPKHKGFGSTLIGRAVQAGLGPTRLEFDPRGLAFSVAVPLSGTDETPAPCGPPTIEQHRTRECVPSNQIGTRLALAALCGRANKSHSL